MRKTRSYGGLLARRRFGSIWAICVTLFASSAAHGLPTDEKLRDLQLTTFGSKEGAPSDAVAMTQTTDGFIWLGTQSGLLRFDGKQFDRIHFQSDKPLPASVYSLLPMESGGMWIGYQLGGAAFSKDGHAIFYSEKEGLPPGSVKKFAEDQQGRLWAATNGGLARFDGTRWQIVGAEEGYTEKQANTVMSDSAGTLWVASKSKLFFLAKNEKVFCDTGIVLDGPGSVIAEAPSGRVMIGNAARLFTLVQNVTPGTRARTAEEVIFDRDGARWEGIYGGLIKRLAKPDRADVASNNDPEIESLSDADGFRVGSEAGGVLEDQDGNVWVATERGLNRFSVSKVARFQPFPKPKAPLPSRTAGLAKADAGAVWVNDMWGTLILLHDRTVQYASLSRISCSLRAADGSLWFGASTGLWRYADDHFERKSLPEGSDGFDVQAMAQDTKGELWVSIVRQGVFHHTSAGWEAYGNLVGLPKLTAVSLEADAQGRIWFGYTDGRVAMLNATKVSEFGFSAPLPIGNVKAIYGQRTHVWAGGDQGVTMYDGVSFKELRSEDDGRFSFTTGIVETKNGDLWINATAGIVHVAASELLRAENQPDYRVRSELFDMSDGVEGDSARLRPIPTAIEGTDDRLWFTRSIGLYSIRPDHMPPSAKAPAVFVETLTTDQTSYSPPDPIRLPPNTRSLHIDYVGLNLTTPDKVRYRYKLDGVDSDWQNAESRRQAFYTNLAPGHHRFHVTASNDDGVWAEPAATLEFDIQPTFFQTGWFIALCIALGGTLVWLLLRLRLRQISAGMRLRLEERMDERERIARELHDTLLQGTQALVLNVEEAAKRARQVNADSIYPMLEEAAQRAQRIFVEGRDRIYDLRLDTDPSEDLGRAFANLAQELQGLKLVSFDVTVEGRVRPLVLKVREEAYRIGREALLNAFRHANASSIEVQIIFARDALRIRVRDDGAGLDESAFKEGARPGHWGLPGMRERAVAIGGKLEIFSRLGAGTEIDLYVPKNKAYLIRRNFRSWLRQSPRNR